MMAKMVSDIAEIKTQNSQIKASSVDIQKKNEEIIQSMIFMNKQFEEMKTELDNLKKQRHDQQKYIENLEQKIIDLQQKSRSSGIELRNIPVEKLETSASLFRSVKNIGEAVGVHINQEELRDLYRLPGKSSSAISPRPIIVEFTTVLTQQTLLTAVRSFNSGKKKEEKLNTLIIGASAERQPLYVAEQLTASAKKLLYQAREFAKNNSYKYCWTSNGLIFLRRKEGDNR